MTTFEAMLPPLCLQGRARHSSTLGSTSRQVRLARQVRGALEESRVLELAECSFQECSFRTFTVQLFVLFCFCFSPDAVLSVGLLSGREGDSGHPAHGIGHSVLFQPPTSLLAPTALLCHLQQQPQIGLLQCQPQGSELHVSPQFRWLS